jgi:hypothetical protein
MDAFTDKVKAPETRQMRVVSLRSVDTVDLLRLRSTHRYLLRQRDALLGSLGNVCMEMLKAGGLQEARLRERASEIAALDAQIADVAAQLSQAQQEARLSSYTHVNSPFLTVCACGAPLYPEDVRCGACGNDVEDLIRLARETKSRQADVKCTCGLPLPLGVKFCPECGRSAADLMDASGAASCPSCEEAASPGDRFCSACGASLGGS